MSLTDALSPTLNRLRMRYAQSPLPAFLGWWGAQLRACLPANWRAALEVRESEVWVRREENGIHVVTSQAPTTAVLVIEPGEAVDSALEFERGVSEEMRARRRVLLLPEGHVLRRRLQMPMAARDNLRAVLGFELDRQTPFRADQVHFDFRVLPHDGTAKTLPVELAIVPREVLAAALAGLGELGKDLDVVDTATSGRRAGYNFLPDAQRRRRVDRVLWINVGLAGLSVFFLLLAMSQLVDNRTAAVEALHADVDAQREAARGVTVLRQNLEDAVAGANFLAVRKTEQPNVVALLDALTKAFPDDTYLERMSVSGATLSVTGYSGQAPKLIELLRQASGVRDASLSGPIQPDPRTGKDRFNITAQTTAVVPKEAQDATASGG